MKCSISVHNSALGTCIVLSHRSNPFLMSRIVFRIDSRERNLNGTRDNRVSGNLIYRLRPDDANRNVNQFNLSCGWARCNGSVCYDPKIDIVNKVENEFIILRWKLRRIRSRRQSAQLHLQTRPTKLQLYLSEQKTIISSRENIKCNEKRSK